MSLFFFRFVCVYGSNFLNFQIENILDALGSTNLILMIHFNYSELSGGVCDELVLRFVMLHIIFKTYMYILDLNAQQVQEPCDNRGIVA